MQEYLKGPLSVHLRRAAMAVLVSGAVAANFVSPLEDQAEPARFSQGGDAASDLPWLRDPQLKTMPALTLPDTTFTRAAQDDARPARDYPVLDTLTEYELSRIFDVKRVRAQLTTGGGTDTR